MSGREDTRVVDHLYGELSEEEAREYRRALDVDPALAAEAEALESFEETLGLMRKLEAEDPPPHLDALVLAHARQEAEKIEENERGFGARLRKIFRSRALVTALVGSVAAVAAVVTISQSALYRLDEARAPAQAISVTPRSTLVPADEAEPPPPPSSPPQEKATDLQTLERAASKPLEQEKSEAGQAGKDDRREKRRPELRVSPARRDREAAKSKKTKPEEAMFEDLKKSGDDAEVEGAIAEPKAAEPVRPEPVRPEPVEPAPRTESEPERQGAKIPPPAKPTQPAPAVQQAQPAKSEAPAVAGKRADKNKAAALAEEMDETHAAKWARDMIAAAESQLAQKDSVGARNILVNALERTRGTAAYGDLALRLAQLDFAQGRFNLAAHNARVAANVPRFARRHEALELLARANRETDDLESTKRAKAAPVTAPPAAAETNEADTAR